MVPQRSPNFGKYPLRRQAPPRVVPRGLPPMRNPSEMFFGRPPEKKPSEGKFIGGKNFYILLVGLIIIIVILLLSGKGSRGAGDNPDSGNSDNNSYQFLDNVGNSGGK